MEPKTLYNKICSVCGSYFVSTNFRAQLCADCLEEHAKRKAVRIGHFTSRGEKPPTDDIEPEHLSREEWEKKAKASHKKIADISVEAWKKEGLSYGQYVAKHGL